VTKISQLSSIGDSLAAGDQFLIRDIDDTGSPNKSVTISGMTRALDTGTALAPALAFASDKNTGIYSPGADQVAISTNGTGRLFIDSAGKIGIGITSPIGKLDVTGSNVPLIVQSTVAASNYIVHRHVTSGDIAYIGNGGGGAITAGTASDYVIRANLGSLIFACDGDNERARIDGSGNVGIGTTSPLTKLDVRSGVITAGTLESTNGAEVLRGYYSGGGALMVLGAEYSSGGPLLGSCVKPSTSAQGAFLSSTGIAGATRGAYVISGTEHKWYIGAAQTVAENSSVTMSEAMRIDSSGRLLVGTSSDSGGALLQVNGDRVRIATAKTPASAGATGTTGEICWDANYIYVCTATNTWKRTAISTW